MKKQGWDTGNDSALNLVSSILHQVAKMAEDPTKAKEGLEQWYSNTVLTMLGISFIPYIGEFADFGTGSIIAQMLGPFASRLVSMPVDDMLEDFYRFKNAPPRYALDAFEDGVIDEAAAIDTCIDDGLKDKEIDKLMARSRFKRRENLMRRSHDVEKQLDDVQFKIAVDQIDRVITEVRAIERDADTLIATEIREAISSEIDDITNRIAELTELEKVLKAQEKAAAKTK
jgi:hypothetical protein